MKTNASSFALHEAVAELPSEFRAVQIIDRGQSARPQASPRT